MPLLSDTETAQLLTMGQAQRACGECGIVAAKDYCRTCDHFYWLHGRGCRMFDDHAGHRLTIVPFVEVRGGYGPGAKT